MGKGNGVPFVFEKKKKKGWGGWLWMRVVRGGAGEVERGGHVKMGGILGMRVEMVV